MTPTPARTTGPTRPEPSRSPRPAALPSTSGRSSGATTSSDTCASSARTRSAADEASLDPRRPAGAHVRGVLHGVVERCELHAQRRLDQAVRQPHVLRQQRPVEVGADHVPAMYSLQPVAAVVAVAPQHPAERPLAVAEIGAAAVVLEPRDHPLAAAQVGLDRAVADQARPRLANGPEVHQAHARKRLVAHRVARPEQLVAAAHRQDNRSPLGGGVQPVALRLDHVARHERLVAVLPAAHVEGVVRCWIDGVPERRCCELEPEPAPLTARAQHRDVATVRVDVHELRIQRADAQGRGHQRTPRTATMLPTYSPLGGTWRRRSGRNPAASASASSSSAPSASSTIVAIDSSSSPVGETAWRTRSIAVPPSSDRTATGVLENTQPSCSRTSGSGGPVTSGDSPSNGSVSAAARTPPGARCSRARSSIAVRASRPPIS